MYGGDPLLLSQIKRKFKLKKYTEELPLIKRFALHAQKLVFNNFERDLSVEAPYPKDITVLKKQLLANKR